MEEGRVIDALVAGGYVSEEEAVLARQFADSGKGSVADYVVQQQLVTKDILGQAVAESYRVFYADLNTNIPSKKQVLEVPEEIARKFRVVLFRVTKGEAIFTTDNPDAERLGPALQQSYIRLGIVKYFTKSEARLDEIIADISYSLEENE